MCLRCLNASDEQGPRGGGGRSRSDAVGTRRPWRHHFQEEHIPLRGDSQVGKERENRGMAKYCSTPVSRFPRVVLIGVLPAGSLGGGDGDGARALDGAPHSPGI